MLNVAGVGMVNSPPYRALIESSLACTAFAETMKSNRNFKRY